MSFHKAGVEALRESYESLGFYSALEIEYLLKASGAYRRQAERWEGARRSFARQGIPDANWIEALWAVDIGLIRGRVCGGASEGFGAGKRKNGGSGCEGKRRNEGKVVY